MKTRIWDTDESLQPPRLRVSYSRAEWSKDAAWNHLVRNPHHSIKVPEGVKYNPYRKNHDGSHWCWFVIPYDEKENYV